MLIWQTIYGNVIVGPTAEYIESKTDRSNSAAVLADLKSLNIAIQLTNIQTARDLIQSFPDNEEFPQFLNGARSLLAKE